MKTLPWNELPSVESEITNLWVPIPAVDRSIAVPDKAFPLSSAKEKVLLLFLIIKYSWFSFILGQKI